MSDHPYKAPTANLVEDSLPEGRLYSPLQAAAGAFLGGPIGVVYFLWANFRALNKFDAASKTVAIGVASTFLLTLLLMLLPEDFPGAPITFLYMYVAYAIANKYQMSKNDIAASESFTFHSNWRVFGYGLLCLLGTTVIIGGFALAALSLGLIE